MSVRDIRIIASNRARPNVREIFFVPIVSFLIVGLIFNFLVGIVVGLINLVLYPLVRFATWVFYKELILNKNNLYVHSKFLKRTLNSRLITNNFDKANLITKEITVGGKSKFIVQYKTHKTVELLVIDNKDMIKVVTQN